MSGVGRFGRLGAWTADHFKAVVVAWVVIAVGFGVFAPRAEHALSGAGWEATGSESVFARGEVDRAFGGEGAYALMVIVSGDGDLEPALGRVRGILEGDDRIASVSEPQRSESGRTAIVTGRAAASPTEMVAAATALKDDLTAAGDESVTVSLTGAPGMWSDFNEANKSAMLKSELISWPVTLAVLVLAFGSLAAAGLPLLLTILGLVSAAGSLFLVSQAFDVSIWAMNFALMFALALGIDYALFIVARFRGAVFGSKLPPREAVAVTMDTAGKAVLFSGVTVLISLSAVMLVPSPAFRSMSLGIMLSVIFVLLAALTLLPAVLARLGDRVDKLALPWVHAGEHRSPRFERWAKQLWRRPWAYGLAAAAILVALSLSVFGLETGMPSIKVVPEEDGSRVGYTQVQEAFGPGAPGTLQVIMPAAQGEDTAACWRPTRGSPRSRPPSTRADPCSSSRRPPPIRPTRPLAARSSGCARHSRPRRSSAGRRREPRSRGGAREPDAARLRRRARARLPLLLLALQAPVIAAVGVILNLLAVAAAFGVARLIFQDGRESPSATNHRAS